MKLIDQRLIRKNSNLQTQKSIAKHTLEPRGVTLRSRKIQYVQELPFESSDNQSGKDHQAYIKLNQKTIKKFDQTPQKLKSNPYIEEQNLDTVKKGRQQDRFYQSNFPQDMDQEQSPEEKYLTPIKRKRRQCRPHPLKKILDCEYFKQVKEIDFLTYFGILQRKKMFSTLLIDDCGQIIFADRLGSEHFEGSLNNFARNPIYSTILEQELQDFFEKVSWIEAEGRTIVKLIIYSKNSKRRYSKKPTDRQLTNNVIFNRYLRCISCQIKPIRITISSTDQFQGYWNKNLITQNKPLNCYLLTSRLAKTMPSLEKFDLKQDWKIQKFLKYTKKKQDERGFLKSQKKSSRREDQESQKALSNFMIEKQSCSELLSYREYEHILHEMNDHNKYSKTTMTRGYVINSGGGKSQSERERI